MLVLLAAFNGMEYFARADGLHPQPAASRSPCRWCSSIDRSSDGTGGLGGGAGTATTRECPCCRGGRFWRRSAQFFRLLRDVDMAGFDYVALADQDDLWHPDKLARACQQLQLTGAAGYSGNVTAFWPGGQERLIDKAQPQQPLGFFV